MNILTWNSLRMESDEAAFSMLQELRLVHNILYVLRHNRKSLFFQWSRMRRDAGIEPDSIPAK